MIKLKFNLDPSDKNQMLALSRFAGTLAGAGVEIETNKPEGIKLAAVAADAEAQTEVKEAPKEVEAPKTRTRRTKAEIEAERLKMQAEEAPEEEQEVDETEDGEPEAESEDAEEQAPAGKSTAERNGKQITMDDLRAAVVEKKDKHFEKMKKELINKYGVSVTPKLPEEHWAAFFDFVNGLD